MRWSEIETTLAANLPSFRRRPIQAAMAEACETSWEAGHHILAEAGTGTGKSFVAAANAYAQAIRTGLPVGLATGTKALQDQYSETDFPFLADRVIPGFRFAVLKGRSNYVCLQKVEELGDASVKSAVESQGDDFSGEIIDLGLSDELAPKLSTSSEECPGKKDCPFGNSCFAEKAKEKAKSSHVVIVNHALLAADTVIKQAMLDSGVPEEKVTAVLPRLGGVVIDEAHTFGDSVTDALGGEVTAGSYRRLASEVANFLGTKDAVAKVSEKSTALFNVVTRELAKRDRKSDTKIRATDAQLAQLIEPMIELEQVLVSLSTKVEGHGTHGDDRKTQQKKRLVKKLNNAAAKLLAFAMTGDEEMVRGLALGEGIKGDSITWAPLNVGTFLNDSLWTKTPALLMSATLSISGKFDYVKESLGFVGRNDVDTYIAGSAFDLSKQAMTFVPNIAAPVKQTEGMWRAQAQSLTGELIAAAGGRALLLFTSRREMEETYTVLAPSIKRKGITVLKQGEGTNKELKRQFQADETSVLFGLASFMTGVDFQGDTLRLVVLNKLPFPVPTDLVLAARTELADRKASKFAEKGFNKITVPIMAMILRQAYGRLIRTVTDTGVVAIMDSRLYGPEAKYYGKVMMPALGNAPVTDDVEVACNFLAKS